MSTIRDYAQSNYYDRTETDITKYNQNAGSFLSGLNINTDSGIGSGGSVNLSDYAMIKNGSYKKLVKAYYANQKAENASSGKDSSQKLTMLSSNASAMAKSVSNLMKDSLWEKKSIKTKNAETGEEEEKEDYDWDGITKAVRSFVENYNRTIEASGSANTKEVLRNAVWMIDTTKANEKLLSKIGISIGSGNKLEIDEDKLRNADISTLKTLFTGHNSYASKMYDKAQSITGAAGRYGGAYTKAGKYTNYPSSILPTNIDTKE